VTYSSERQFYRLDFPPKERPGFVVGELVMPVVEVSEGGMRYEPVSGHRPEIGEQVDGVVRFRQAGDVEVRGTVSRWQGSTVVVIFERPGLPYAAIMQEQRFLMRRYPERFRGRG
jgi:hypothetical protein